MLVKNKYYELTSLIIMGLFLVILGFILLIGKSVTYQFLIYIVIFVLWLSAFREVFRFVFRKLGKGEETTTFVSCVFHLFVCLFFSLIPKVALGLVPFLFACYLIIVGLSKIVICILYIRNRDFIRFWDVVVCLVSLSIGIPIIVTPVLRLNNFLVLFSIYSIFLGFSMLGEIFFRLLKNKKHLMKVRVRLPKIIEAIIPYSVMVEINRNLSLNKRQVYSFDKDDRKSDLDILVHTSNRGVNRMGHIDICFEGMVYSFGNYDEGSRMFREFFGDGVLFTTSKKINYINFCIDNSKKTIFDFGIILNDKQKDAVRKRIDEIMMDSVSWSYKDDKKYLDGDTYSSKLYKKTKCKFYKFNKGKYHTYFVLGTNCCFLVDDVIGKSGMNIISLNGIITPGTYYDYLERELRLKSSNVISKEIYNWNRKDKRVKK